MGAAESGVKSVSSGHKSIVYYNGLYLCVDRVFWRHVLMITEPKRTGAELKILQGNIDFFLYNPFVPFTIAIFWCCVTEDGKGVLGGAISLKSKKQGIQASTGMFDKVVPSAIRKGRVNIGRSGILV